MDTIINGDRLKAAAEAGDVDLLYTVIQDAPYILEHIDSIPFVETPLHIAASMGHLDFAIETMNLKPSFALKLDPQGFSPIHLAMQNNQELVVYRFVFINKDLVRVKGRKGITPLHYASEIGEVKMLAYFLLLCPESIESMTVRRETALHIAVKNEQFEALQVLVSWLKKNIQRGAQKLEKKILNQRDKARNTILHISALSSDPQALLLLISTGINLNAKNREDKTALDIASTPEIKSILLSVGAKPGTEVTDDCPRFDLIIRSKITIIDAVTIYIDRIRGDMLEEERNIWLIAATLVATAIYQSGLSPPGGIYQVSASDTNVNITSSNSTISTPGNTGKSVLSGYEFYWFVYFNMYSFTASILAILIMIPYGIIGGLVVTPMGSFTLSYIFSMWRISPTHVNSVILFIVFVSNLLYLVIEVVNFGVYSRLKHGIAKILNMTVKALFQ